MEFFKSKYFNISMRIIFALIIFILLKTLDFAILPVAKALGVFIVPLAFGLIFYYVFRPLYRKLAHSPHVNKSAATVFVVVLLVVLALGLLAYAGLTIGRQSVKAFSDFMTWLEKMDLSSLDLASLSIPFIDQAQITNALSSLQDSILQLFNNLSKNLPGLVGGAASAGYQIVMIPLFVFYFLKDDRAIIDNLLGLFSKDRQAKIKVWLKDADRSVSDYIRGQMLVALVVGILMFIGYAIIGMPTKIFLAVFAMVTSIIPFLGPFLGVLPALFIALTTDLWMLVKVLLVFVLAQQIEGNLITPKIMSSRLPIHPLTVIILVVVVTSLFGLVGGLVAVPGYILAKLLIKAFLKHQAEEGKEKEGHEEDQGARS